MVTKTVLKNITKNNGKTSSQNMYKDILDPINDGIYLLDKEMRIVYWNKGAQEITGFSDKEVLGKCCKDNILRHIDDKGTELCKKENCPAYKTIQTGKVMECDGVYVHHKDWHRIPISVRTSPFYDDKNKIAGAIELFSAKLSKKELEEKIKYLEKLAMLDQLTKVGNRRFGETQIERCMNQLKRYNWPFGVLFIDIDHFKKINDTYGHEVGDDVLKMTTKTIASKIRSFDHVVRWGGEEFLVIIMNIDSNALKEMAEKIRKLVENSFIMFNQNKIAVSASIGATMCKPDDSSESLIERADKLMYESKKTGRNKITVD